MTIQTPPQGSNQPSAGFDPNESAPLFDGVRLPSTFDTNIAITDAEAYARFFERLFLAENEENPIKAAAKALVGTGTKLNYGYEKARGIEGTQDVRDILKGGSVAKAGKTVPSAFAYGRMSYMPDSAVNGGVIQWPGINPDSLRKIARENIAAQLIIGMRVDDVIRYSQYSDQLWKPGWRIEGFPGGTKVKDKEVQEAVRFLHNSNIDLLYTQARERDGQRMTDFQRFLSAMVRDSLTFDMIAVWTDMQNDEKVKSYALLPAGNIRFCTPDGYNGNPKNYAVAVDDGGRVVQAFTRDELTCYVRNIRNDADVWGYGWPEIEIGMRVIKGFQNALDLNIDIFDRSAIANGILTISGGAVTQRQLDLLNRLITNMKKGITKSWVLPVIGLQGDSKLELVDLSKIKGNEAYYKEFMNMLAGALCTLWRFPVRRLGYKISGSHKDNEPLPDSSTAVVDDDDPGLAPLLMHIESIINQYLLSTRWPHLRFRFTGKNPKEDAREYEAQSLARTYGERREELGLSPLASLVKKPKVIKKKDSESDDEESSDGEDSPSKGKKDKVAKANYKVRVKFKNADGKTDSKKPGEENEEGKEGLDSEAPEEADPEEEAEDFQQKMLYIAALMDLAPMDPNLASVYQACVNAVGIGGDSGGGGGEGGAGKQGGFGNKGNLMNSKTDPARSESHGATSGVRRDSRSEKGK